MKRWTPVIAKMTMTMPHIATTLKIWRRELTIELMAIFRPLNLVTIRKGLRLLSTRSDLIPLSVVFYEFSSAESGSISVAAMSAIDTMRTR